MVKHFLLFRCDSLFQITVKKKPFMGKILMQNFTAFALCQQISIIKENRRQFIRDMLFPDPDRIQFPFLTVAVQTVPELCYLIW